MMIIVKVSKVETSIGCILHYCLTIVMLTTMWIPESGVEHLLNWSFNSRCFHKYIFLWHLFCTLSITVWKYFKIFHPIVCSWTKNVLHTRVLFCHFCDVATLAIIHKKKVEEFKNPAIFLALSKYGNSRKSFLEILWVGIIVFVKILCLGPIGFLFVSKWQKVIKKERHQRIAKFLRWPKVIYSDRMTKFSITLTVFWATWPHFDLC